MRPNLRLISTVLIALALLAAACGSDDGDTEAPTTDAADSATSPASDDGASDTADAAEEPSEAEPSAADAADDVSALGEDVRIGVVALVASNEGGARTINGLRAAAEGLGWELQVEDASGDLNAAVTAFQNLLQTEPDAMITLQIPSAGWGPQIQAAADAGIPHMTFYGGGHPEVVFDATIDPAVEGATLGQYVAGRLGADAKVLILNSECCADLIRRELVFRAVIEGAGGEILERHELAFPGYQEDAQSQTDAWLLQYGEGEANVIFSGFDEPGVAASRVVDNAGRDDIIVVGADGSRQSIEAIQRGGSFVATTGDDFEALGAFALEQLVNVLEGGEPPARQFYIPGPLVTAANIDQVADGYYSDPAIQGPYSYFTDDAGFVATSTAGVTFVDVPPPDVSALGEDVRIGVVALVASNEGGARTINGLRAAAEGLGWELQVEDASGDLNAAVTAFQNLLQTEPDAMITLQIPSAGWGPQIQAAADAGIPHMTFYGGGHPEVVFDAYDRSRGRGRDAGAVCGRPVGRRCQGADPQQRVLRRPDPA